MIFDTAFLKRQRRSIFAINFPTKTRLHAHDWRNGSLKQLFSQNAQDSPLNAGRRNEPKTYCPLSFNVDQPDLLTRVNFPPTDCQMIFERTRPRQVATTQVSTLASLLPSDAACACFPAIGQHVDMSPATPTDTKVQLVKKRGAPTAAG